MKTTFEFLNVFTRQDRGHDCRIGRWAANPFLFKGLHERRFCKPRRWISEMLFGNDPVESERLAFLYRRQRSLSFVVLFSLFIATFLINLQEAVKLLHRTACPEYETSSSNIDGGLIKNSRCHLRSNRPLPDQTVKFQLVFIQIFCERIGRACDL